MLIADGPCAMSHGTGAEVSTARDQIFDEQIAREKLRIEAGAAGVVALEHALEGLGRATGRECEGECLRKKSSVEA